MKIKMKSLGSFVRKGCMVALSLLMILTMQVNEVSADEVTAKDVVTSVENSEGYKFEEVYKTVSNILSETTIEGFKSKFDDSYEVKIYQLQEEEAKTDLENGINTIEKELFKGNVEVGMSVQVLKEGTIGKYQIVDNQTLQELLQPKRLLRSSFSPRLTEAGMENNKWWYSGLNKFYPSYGLPNCTAYAYGRLLEINNGVNVGLPTGGAGSWYNATGISKGSTPKLGAVMCFSGHVAVVEEIGANGDVTVSESNYGGKSFNTTRLSKSNNYSYGDHNVFQGFIYANIEETVPVQPPIPKKSIDYVMPTRNANGMLTIVAMSSLGNGNFGNSIPTPYGSIGFDTDSVGQGTGAFADINGDGRADYAMPTRNANGMLTIVTMLSLGNGNFGNAIPTEYGSIGFNTDSIGQGTGTFADINGDGKADYVMPTRRANGMLTILTMLSLGNGNFGNSIPTPYGSIGFDTDSIGQGTGTFADINGDGKADYVMPTRRANGMLTILTMLSLGNGNFGNAIPTEYGSIGFNTDSIGQGTGTFADINGDGKADYVMPTRNANGMLTILTMLSLGNGNFGNAIPTEYGSIGFNTDSIGQGTGTFADINGDGKADYVMPTRRADGMLTILTMISLGNGNFGNAIPTPYGSIGFDTDSIGQGTGTFADINGDGKADYVMPTRKADGMLTILTMLSLGNGNFGNAIPTEYGSIGFDTDNIGQGTGRFVNIDDK